MEIFIEIKLKVKDGMFKSRKELEDWINELDYDVSGYGIQDTEIVNYDLFDNGMEI